MVLKYWKMMTRSVKSISSRCSGMIFFRIDRFVSLLLVASLLLCCVPALGVSVVAIDGDLLYNGVLLPPLPSDVSYSYQFIVYDKTNNAYRLICGDGYSCYSSGFGVIGPGQYFWKWSNGTSFVTGGSINSGSSMNFSSKSYDFIWCNVDFYYTEGENVGQLFFEGSDPVDPNAPTNPSSSITSVSVTGSQQVYKGDSSSYGVSVLGEGSFDPSANLVLSGNSSSSTSLVFNDRDETLSTYTLYCGSDETSFSLTLTASSVQDPSITDSLNVVVLDNPNVPTEPVDPLPTDPPSSVPFIETSFDGQVVYVPVGEQFGLLFWASGYDNMSLKYYENDEFAAEADLIYDTSSGVLYGGFFVYQDVPDSYTEVRIDAYSGGTFVDSYSCTVVCADPPSPDGSDQVIINKIDELGGDITQIQDHVELVDKKVDTILTGGENGPDLTDQSGQISDDLSGIHDFEQSQKDVLDNNMDFILGTFAFDDFIPALAFVGGYINKAFVSMSPIQLIYFVPLVIGLFFFICSRAPGATRWKPRRPPPDPTKKK